MGVHQIKGGHYIIRFLGFIDVQNLKEHTTAAKELLGDKQLPFLLDFTEPESGIDFEALSSWSTNIDLNQHRTVEAYVANTLTNKVSISQHIRLNQPNYEVMVFNTLLEAKNWLAKFNMK